MSNFITRFSRGDIVSVSGLGHVIILKYIGVPHSRLYYFYMALYDIEKVIIAYDPEFRCWLLTSFKSEEDLSIVFAGVSSIR